MWIEAAGRRGYLPALKELKNSDDEDGVKGSEQRIEDIEKLKRYVKLRILIGLWLQRKKEMPQLNFFTLSFSYGEKGRAKRKKGGVPFV